MSVISRYAIAVQGFNLGNDQLAIATQGFRIEEEVGNIVDVLGTATIELFGVAEIYDQISLYSEATIEVEANKANLILDEQGANVSGHAEIRIIPITGKLEPPEVPADYDYVDIQHRKITE